MRKTGLTMAAVLTAAFAAAPASAQDAPARTLFTNVQVWDGTSDSRVSADVLVEGEMIVGVGSGLSSSGATVIDGGGRTLMPGLIDMHTHLMFPRGLPDHENVWDGAASGAMAFQGMQTYVQNGFTTLRDMCGPASLSRAIASGALTGPRYFSSGACNLVLLGACRLGPPEQHRWARSRTTPAWGTPLSRTARTSTAKPLDTTSAKGRRS